MMLNIVMLNVVMLSVMVPLRVRLELSNIRLGQN
jgi:hypothetical protein